MSERPPGDAIIKDVLGVRPSGQGVAPLDVAVRDGSIAHIAPDIPSQQGADIIDGCNLLGFPGLVDAHMHVGIYHELEEDAESESQAAAMGGVTSSINYMRTGRYYLNKTGPY